MDENKKSKPENDKQQQFDALYKKVKASKTMNRKVREIKRFMAKKKQEKTEIKTTDRKLADKQQRLVDCWDGNIKTTAEKAKVSYGYARQQLTKTNILEAIKNRENTEIRPATIADRAARQKFWTTVMNSTSEEMKDRLKASELLGKSEADFTENIKHSGEIKTPALKIVLNKK